MNADADRVKERRLQDTSSKSREHRKRVLQYQARIAAECTASAESRRDPQMTIPLVVEVKANGSPKTPPRRARRSSGAMQPNLGDDL
jgi:hypothetical protein